MVESGVIVAGRGAERELSLREKEILRRIIHLYILQPTPVGSRTLSKYIHEEWSAATIRNVMSDLEELDFISHPHTSAGRIPTDKGYRFYVDSLGELEPLPKSELLALEKTFSNSDMMYKDASKILGMLSSYLSIVAIPQLVDLKVQRIEIIALSSNRLLIVIALDSNVVRTVTLETGFETESKQLDRISSYINEKVSGKPLKFIRDNFAEMLRDYRLKDTPLMRLFVDSIDSIMNIRNAKENIHIAGTPNLLDYPEFGHPERIKGVIELLENEDIIVHLLEKQEEGGKDINVLIGSEIQNELLDDYALVISNYKIGDARGSIGIIGPKRMPYAKMMSLVKNVSEFLNKE